MLTLAPEIHSGLQYNNSYLISLKLLLFQTHLICYVALTETAAEYAADVISFCLFLYL